MKMNIVLWAVALLHSTAVIAPADNEHSDAVQQQDTDYIDTEASGMSFRESATTVVFSIDDVGVSSNLRYWDGPSFFSINSDGTWFFYATRLANFDRDASHTGKAWRAQLEVRYFSNYDPDSQSCTGDIVHSSTYGLATIPYMQQLRNYSRRWDDEVLAAQHSRTHCMRYKATWY